ncbi:DEAD/DEAH box helicase [Anaerovorax odorimutans]|uniref:DEAD/DEAH box helicase n=1 Tax=Anaerovorax odorimutans TaxID=109327 RepID=A0ABT1RSQ3_9FIRM|nr:DEAD/DEAH box helicase [Anaerovorax odorimutans]MCQ4638233.1 DEAD/DEAH box helicase [Anaerovorax odorimutans]
MIELDQLKRSTLARFYTRGKQLYEQGHVRNLTVQSFGEGGGAPSTHVKGEVLGSSGQLYKTSVFIRKDKMFSYGCTCPAVNQFPYPCKHCIALAMRYRQQQEDAAGNTGAQFLRQELQRQERMQEERFSRSLSSSAQVKDLIYQYSMRDKARFFQAEINGSVDLEPILHKSRGLPWQLEFKIGTEKRKYVLKNIVDFVRAVEKKETVAYGKNLEFIHEASAFTKRAQRFYEFLRQCLEERSAQDGRYSYLASYRSPEAIRKLNLTDKNLADFFSIMRPQPCQIGDGGAARIYFTEEEPRLELALVEAAGGGYDLAVPKAQMVSNDRETYLVSEDKIYQCSDEFRDRMEELCDIAGGRYGGEVLHIGERDMQAFCTSVLPQIQEFSEIAGLEAAERFMPEPCQIRFYLDKEDGMFVCRPESLYGEGQRFNLLEKLDVSEMYRDAAAEGKAVWTAGRYFPERDDRRFLLDEMDEDRVYELFTDGIIELEQLGEVFLSAALNRISIRQAPEVGIHVGLDSGLLDLSIDAGDMPQEEMEDLLQAYRLKKKYYRLKNGDFMRLADSGLEAVWELADGLGLTDEDLRDGHIRVPQYRSFYIDQVLKACDGAIVSRSSSFKTLLRNIKAVEDSDYEVPAPMVSVMRSYQKNGYRWLMTLRDLGFGGILADDMGLGKSLQMLAFLYAAREEAKKSGAHRTNLLICPASLVYNWMEEVIKFAPDMKTLLITGTAAEREMLVEDWEQYDILITSYDLLKRDEGNYIGKTFYCQILDEAQNIKNHQTKAAKAAKKIQAQVRFALTGTPIENRLSELWSIFDYLMPGILGSYASFRKKYELPIVQNGDAGIAQRLQRMISPFILRRLKRDVLKELPDKNETIVYARMEKEQEAIYRANARQLSETIAGKNGDQFRTGKIEILSALTRLRQLCCDPHLVYENYEGSAAKLDTCMELLETAIESEQKVLLFSQFTSMLDLIAKELEQRGIPYYMLTGATGKKERLEMVHQFNEGDVPLFLISLKAGGTGLNLTGATVVIHYDPWWNVAAENQASDRAHRIGQDKQVTVFKLIMQDTIEERIRRLQESKAHLADEMVSGQGMALSQLTREDFMELLRV